MSQQIKQALKSNALYNPLDRTVGKVIGLIADLLNSHCNCELAWPSEEYLARKCGISVRQIERIIRKVKAIGCFEIVPMRYRELIAYAKRKYGYTLEIGPINHKINTYRPVPSHFLCSNGGTVEQWSELLEKLSCPTVNRRPLPNTADQPLAVEHPLACARDGPTSSCRVVDGDSSPDIGVGSSQEGTLYDDNNCFPNKVVTNNNSPKDLPREAREILSERLNVSEAEEIEVNGQPYQDEAEWDIDGALEIALFEGWRRACPKRAGPMPMNNNNQANKPGMRQGDGRGSKLESIITTLGVDTERRRQEKERKKEEEEFEAPEGLEYF